MLPHKLSEIKVGLDQKGYYRTEEENELVDELVALDEVFKVGYHQSEEFRKIVEDNLDLPQVLDVVPPRGVCACCGRNL